MQIHSIEYGTVLSYPVGRDMEAAKNFIDTAVKEFKKIDSFKEKDINIFCRGSSGAMLGALFAVGLLENRLQVKIVHVKKPGERSHRDNEKPLRTKGCINIIVDDLVSSGETLSEINKYMNVMSVFKADCIIVDHFEGFPLDQMIKFKFDHLIVNQPIHILTQL